VAIAVSVLALVFRRVAMFWQAVSTKRRRDNSADVRVQTNWAFINRWHWTNALQCVLPMLRACRSSGRSATISVKCRPLVALRSRLICIAPPMRGFTIIFIVAQRMHRHQYHRHQYHRHQYHRHRNHRHQYRRLQCRQLPLPLLLQRHCLRRQRQHRQRL
jgi:hypothetical protein